MALPCEAGHDAAQSPQQCGWRAERARKAVHDERGNIQLSLKCLSDRLGVSTGHLGRAFRAHTGIRFRTYLRQIRTVVAKELLITSTLSIKEIADQLGYSFPSNFVRDFRAVTRMNPTQYRDSAATRSTAPEMGVVQ